MNRVIYNEIFITVLATYMLALLLSKEVVRSEI